MKTTLTVLLFSLPLLACGEPEVSSTAESLSTVDDETALATKRAVGRRLFFDTRLS